MEIIMHLLPLVMWPLNQPISILVHFSDGSGTKRGAAQKTDFVPGNKIIAKTAENPTKIAEGQLVRFQKSLLRGPEISPMEGYAARHPTEREDLQLLPLPTQVSLGFVPVHLAFAAPVVTLRHAYLAPTQSQSLLLPPHVAAHRRFGDFSARPLGPQPLVNPMRRVPLLARRRSIRFQNRVDERNHQPQPGPLPLRLLAPGRNRVAQRLTDHASMHAQLLGHSQDRAHPELVLAPNLLEQLHFGSPVHRHLRSGLLPTTE